MKHVARSANLLRPGSSYCKLHMHELEVLDSLPLWMTRLFLALVRISDFKTGMGSTSFGQLVAMCTPLQPRRGPREYVPNERAVRDAVVGFEARRILARDKAASEQARLLFFAVCDRHVEVRPKPKLGGVTPRGVDSRKARRSAALPQ